MGLSQQPRRSPTGAGVDLHISTGEYEPNGIRDSSLNASLCLGESVTVALASDDGGTKLQNVIPGRV
jgi:hypothetical protein